MVIATGDAAAPELSLGSITLRPVRIGLIYVLSLLPVASAAFPTHENDGSNQCHTDCKPVSFYCSW